jgi:hypothetical protein
VVAISVLPPEQGLHTRQAEIPRVLAVGVQQSANEPDGLTLTKLREVTPGGQALSAIDVNQASSAGGIGRQTAPGKVRYKFATRGIAKPCVLDDFLSEAALGQIPEGRRIDEQAIPVQLGRRAQYRCSRWVMLNWCLGASSALSRVASEIANRRWIRVSTEALGSLAEAHVF